MRHCAMGDHEAPDEAFGSCRSSCKACRQNRYRHKQAKYDKKRRVKRMKDRFQVASFRAFFHAARIGGRSCYYALASAMVNSSDDITATIEQSKVDKWHEFDRNRSNG